MNIIIKLLVVLGIFAFAFAILSLFIWFVYKKRLFNFLGLVVVSIGTGLGFSSSFLIGSFMDDKSREWNLIRRLAVSGDVFIWSFAASLIAIPIAVAISRMKIQNKPNL